MQNEMVNQSSYEFDNSQANTISSCVHNKENLVFYPMPNLLQFIEFFLIMSYKQMLAEKEKKWI